MKPIGVTAAAISALLAVSCAYAKRRLPGPKPSPTPSPTATAPQTTVSGAAYYFSTSDGDDSRSAAQAQSPTTPWKSLSKLNAFFPSLNPGDAVLFKRGDAFYGTINVSKSGTSSAPIILGAYGSGAKPVITGLTTLASWSSIGNGIYQSPCPACSATVKMVVLNGQNQPMGRWPNADAANRGYRVISSHSGATSLTDDTLASSPNWTGGEVVIRKNHWVLDRGKISAQSGGTLTFGLPDTPYTLYDVQNGFGYFIQNHPSTLDQFGEWYFEPNSRSLQMYFGTNLPGASTVEVATQDTLISVAGVNYIVFDNLAIRGSNITTLRTNTANHITIQNTDLDFAGENAILNSGGNSSDLHIEGTTINHSNNNSIDFEGVTPNAIIRNSTIQNTAIIPGMSRSGDGQAYAIRTNVSDNLLIEHNQVLNSGYLGIIFLGNNTLVQNNFVNGFCLVKDDGGGIYTYQATGTQRVLNNIVLNGLGAPDGTNDHVASAQGIYIDDYSANVEVAGNTSANNSYAGLILHNSSYINVHDNTFYNNASEQIQQNGGNSHNSLTSNVLVARDASQRTSVINTHGEEPSSFLSGDYNVYARPVDDFASPAGRSILTEVYWANEITYDLAAWQAYTGQDLHARKSPIRVSDPSMIRFEYNATTSSKTVSLGTTSYVDMKGVSRSGSLTLSPYESIVLLPVN